MTVHVVTFYIIWYHFTHAPMKFCITYPIVRLELKFLRRSGIITISGGIVSLALTAVLVRVSSSLSVL